MTKIILYNLINKLKEFDSTVLMTSELPDGTQQLSADGVTEFVTDGVLSLHFLEGTNFRTLKIRKMRYTAHDSHSLDYLFGKDGIEFQEDADIAGKL